jgi:hypothetical protein
MKKKADKYTYLLHRGLKAIVNETITQNNLILDLKNGDRIILVITKELRRIVNT